MKDENIESIMFSQNGHYVAIAASWSFQTTSFDSRKVKHIAIARTEGLAVRA